MCLAQKRSTLLLWAAGIFFGDSAVIKFFGKFEWLEAQRRLEFDFDAIALFGFKFDLPKGGAAKIGSSTGLGSENNVKLARENKKPFFNWIRRACQQAS